MQVWFIRYQLSAYIVSCSAMTAYGLGAVPVFWHLAIESLLLAYRCLNEIAFQRFRYDDLLHHSSMALGSALVTCCTSFNPYAYLLTHLQILHLPMGLYYYRKLLCGNQKNPHLSSQISRTDLGFRLTWGVSVGYRTSLLTFTGLRHLFYPVENHLWVAGAIMLAFVPIILFLDVWWSTFFIKGISWGKYTLLINRSLGKSKKITFSEALIILAAQPALWVGAVAAGIVAITRNQTPIPEG